MGTWGMGPMDNDTALDFRDELAVRPDVSARMEMLAVQLEVLASYSPAERHDTAGVDIALQSGVAACAIIADRLAGEYRYTRAPDEDDPEDFRLEMVGEVEGVLLERATRAISVAQGLQGHPDVAEWNTDEDAAEHRAELEELAERLYGAARGMPGHPLYVLTPEE